MIDSLTALQRWYESRCDGVWEHAHGIEVVTLDNPGWKVKLEWIDWRATNDEGQSD
ncbi:Imm53 family immunity protein [Burkholderia cepacia]|uniref:Imm53 family immunity protein n=1 Tax=Burkholderia cepacia TaxID=292 RepID=UPI0009C09545|nr:Imm53 family immunity protein [Burkholderia cepacia]